MSFESVEQKPGQLDSSTARNETSKAAKQSKNAILTCFEDLRAATRSFRLICLIWSQIATRTEAETIDSPIEKRATCLRPNFPNSGSKTAQANRTAKTKQAQTSPRFKLPAQSFISFPIIKTPQTKNNTMAFTCGFTATTLSAFAVTRVTVARSGQKPKMPNHMIQGARRISRKKMQAFGPA
ncbi:hypothetical protein [Eggerthella lenta]|nr:hypothetical protein [Eggerthella lenta]